MTNWRDQDLPHVQRARQLEAARRLRDGEVTIPLSCGHCNSPSVIEEWQPLTALVSYDPDALDQGSRSSMAAVLRCLACGRLTSVKTAHTVRFQKIRAYIREGVDVDVRPPRG